MASVPTKKGQKTVTGKPVTVVPGFTLVKSGPPALRFADAAGASKDGTSFPSPGSVRSLLPRVASALRRPGIDKRAVFKGRTGNVYAYSIDPSDPSRVIRMSADGTRAVGRLVGEKFVVSKSA